MALDDEPYDGLIIAPEIADDEATLRQLSAHLEYLHPEAMAKIRTLYAGIYRELEAGHLYDLIEAAPRPVTMLQHALEEAINRQAPEGLFFGCIEGRESELGWWAT